MCEIGPKFVGEIVGKIAESEHEIRAFVYKNACKPATKIQNIRTMTGKLAENVHKTAFMWGSFVLLLSIFPTDLQKPLIGLVKAITTVKSMLPAEERTYELDETDEKILALLADPKSGAVEPALSRIGKAVGITPGTVKNRLRNLQDKAIIRGYTGLIDKSLYERDLIFAVILIKLQGSWDLVEGRYEVIGDIKPVEEIYKLPHVLASYFCLGRSDVVLLARFRNQLELTTFLVKDLRRIRGVASTETLFTLPHRVIPMKTKGAAIIPFEK